MSKPKLIRITTVPSSLGILLKGQLKFMSDYFEVVGIASDTAAELPEISEREGVRTISVGMTRQITPFKDLSSLYELYRIFLKEKPLIVHSHTPKAGTLAMLAARLAGVPHRIHTVAGLPLLVATGKKRTLLETVEKFTYSFANLVYVNSEGLRSIILKERFCRPEKLRLLANGSSNGIDTAFFDPELYSPADIERTRFALGYQPDDFVFIFIGRLVRDKGIEELIEAFLKVGKHNHNIKLLLVGGFEPDLDPISDHAISIINSDKRIFSAGFQKDVRPYFAAANAFVFPSYREGFPNVVMQAGAMGLPSIVTDINGCNEIVAEGVNGMIIPVQDAHALAKAMLEMLNNGEKRENMQQNAREMITSRYERRLVWDALLADYKRIIANV